MQVEQFARKMQELKTLNEIFIVNGREGSLLKIFFYVVYQ
jgi:hypothetical protein